MKILLSYLKPKPEKDIEEKNQKLTRKLSLKGFPNTLNDSYFFLMLLGIHSRTWILDDAIY